MPGQFNSVEIEASDAVGKAIAVIEVTKEQQQALDQAEQLPVVLDPRTGQEYLLSRMRIYERARGTLTSCGRGWDDSADDDLIRTHL